MRILVLGLNYAPEPIGTGRYTAGLVKALTSRGHDVRVVTGQPHYPQWQPWDGYGGWTSDIEHGARILRVPHHIPRRPNGAGRLLQQLSFALAALPAMLESGIAWRPHRVISIAPSLLSAPLALFTARLCGAQTWLHVQDFELEAALATGLMSRNAALTRVLRSVEGGILKSFDHVSTISAAMCRRLVHKGLDPEKISEHRNWADPDLVRPLDRPSAFRAKWGITTPHVALYSGAMGRKQGLDLVVAAARHLSHRRDLTFVLCGNGPHRAELEHLAAGLPNLRFADLQPADQVGELLNLGTLHILPQIAEAADLVLPSKLPNMLASGRPVIATAYPGTSLFDEVDGCGLVVEPGNAASFAAAITRLCDHPELAKTLGKAAQQRAETRWSAPVLLAGFVAAIEGGAEIPAASTLVGEHP